MEGGLILLLVLGVVAVASVLWASLAGGGRAGGKTQDAGLGRGEVYELEQRILSIERKINDLTMLGKALEEAANGLEIRGVIEKQENLRNYLIDYCEKYRALLLKKHFTERASVFLAADLSAEARVQGVIELKKDMNEEYRTLLEKSYSDSHVYLDAQKGEIDAASDALLREVVIAATNQIIASESPLSERLSIQEGTAEQLFANGKAGEEELNREYDRFLTEIELS